MIGLGRFGSSVVKELHNSNFEVVVCDNNEKNIRKLEEYYHHHVLGDARELSILDDLNVTNYNAVIVSIGQATEAAILITKKLKDRGCENIIAKALDKDTGEILEAVGATQVIYPEEESGTRLAKRMGFRGLIEYIELSENVRGIEMKVPSDFYDKSLSELNFPRKYGLTVALLLRENSPIFHQFAYEKLRDGDTFLIVGEHKNLSKFIQKFCK